ncbi:HAMP domain-containing histidine kinase [bacterium]|nr:HAMP domain-containing histidine kinase [bacterium]
MAVRLRNKLSFRLIVVISLILLANLAIYTYITVSRLETDLTRTYSQNVYAISDVIKKSTRYSMLLNRREDVHEIIKTVGREENVEKIRIYNKQGTIIFSTDTSEIGRDVNMHADACVMCHKENQTFAQVPLTERIRVYTTDRHRLLGLINPIENEPECYNGSCHAHAAEQKLLGVLDVVVSVDQLDRTIEANTQTIIIASMLALVVIALCIALFITFYLNKPIHEITAGLEKLGHGQLTHKIPVRSQDELGEMAKEFNDMSFKLDQAYKEIKDWSETLNEKVQQKTEELKKIYGQVIQIEKLASLGKLSATVAHELNNPLEGILTYSKLIAKKLSKLQQNGEYEKILEYLYLIADESSRCGKIVKDLLLFSHRDDEQFIECDAAAIVEKCATLLNHHFEIHNITFEKKITVPLTLMCNPQKIEQALIALMMNAIEAMPAGGRLTAEIAQREDTGILRIRDEGTGISPKDLPHIFEPFYTTKDTKGTGLGLAVAYGIITHHKGHIEVESTSAKGTVMAIQLPLPKKAS